MPHLRHRYAENRLKKLASLWPIVGVIGPRQVGKTTLIENQFKLASRVSLDDETIAQDANNSAKTFLSKLETPALIDEVQKVPKLFDALKLNVHKERRPGKFFLTGSVSFSEGTGIRESLTGRIGLFHLHPLTAGEALELPAHKSLQLQFKSGDKARVKTDVVSQHLLKGGMPVPMFIRDATQRSLYWEGWLNTTLLRDLPRLFKKGFDVEFALRILEQLGKIYREGELATVAHFHVKSVAKLKNYLRAFESIFVLRKIPPHDLSTGKDIWYACDSGLAAHLMKAHSGEGETLTLARHFILNEISASLELHEGLHSITYYKSARGSAVEFVVHDTPIRVIPLSEIGKGPWGWYEKALQGAAKTLRSRSALLAAPVDSVYQDGKTTIVPWGIWS